MKILTIGEYFGLSEVLAGRCHGLSVLTWPHCVPAIANIQGVDRAIPFTQRFKLDVRAALQVRTVIRDSRADIVHAFGSGPLASAVLATLGMKNRPKLVSFRGITKLPTLSDPANLITYRNGRIDAHACESNAVRHAMIAGGIPASKCHTVYGCVHPLNTVSKSERFPSSWDIPDDAFVVGTVATMRPVKGIDVLLQAAIACQELRDVYWLLIGPVKDRRIEQLAADPRIRPRVRLPGFQDQAADLVANADLFVMPSRKEGLCRALLEAMLRGVCPIVSNAGGMKEAVRHQQEGLVFQSEDPTQLESHIRTLYQQPELRKCLGEAARYRAATFFSPKSVADRLIDVYRNLLGETSRWRAAA